MIANEAGANVALVNRYFGSKANLFAEVIAARSSSSRCSRATRRACPRASASFVARRIAAETSDPVGRVIDRAGGSPEIRSVLRRRVESAILGPLAERLEGPGARERAALATAIFLGGGSLRRTLGQTATELDLAELERRLTVLYTECLAP